MLHAAVTATLSTSAFSRCPENVTTDTTLVFIMRTEYGIDDIVGGEALVDELKRSFDLRLGFFLGRN